ncbi:hypothetical protein Tco_0465537 [Tanacetum coccineum]
MKSFGATRYVGIVELLPEKVYIVVYQDAIDFQEAVGQGLDRRKRLGAGKSRPHASEGQSNDNPNNSTINDNTDETTPGNIIENLDNPSNGKKQVLVVDGFENTDGGDAHQGPNTSHSRAGEREEDDHDSRMIRSTQQCMKSVVAKHLGVAGIQQQNGLVDETNVTLFVKVRCFLIQSGLSKVFWAKDTTRSTYLVNRSPSSAIGFKKPIDMLGFYWNMGFSESGEYKKTFIGSGVGTGSMQVLHGFEFEVEPQENVDQGAMEKIYAHKSLTFNNTVACEVISKWKAGLKDDMDTQSDVYVLSNGCRKCSDDSDGYYWEYTPDVGMLDKFDRGLQTDIQVFVDFVYAMGRSITHMEALSTTKAVYMTFTEAWKKEIWLKGLLTESRYKLRLVAGIATSALVKGGSRSEVPA